MFGMFLMAIFLCVNLSSCSDDDEEEGGGNGGGVVTTAGLEGTWGMVNNHTWGVDNGEEFEYNNNYDPENPAGRGDSKIVISKTGEKTYYIKWYYFIDGGWQHTVEDDTRISVEGAVITNLDDPNLKMSFSLKDNQLVVEVSETYESGGYHSKMTFKRMSDNEEENGGNNGGNGGGVVAGTLEGTWGLTHDQGWETYNGERYEWNESYDPRNPTEDSGVTKMVVAKAGENTYNIKYYYFEDGGWKHEVRDDMRVSVEGSVITNLDDLEEKYSFSLNNNQLVLEYKEGEGYYEKMTFIRM